MDSRATILEFAEDRDKSRIGINKGEASGRGNRLGFRNGDGDGDGDGDGGRGSNCGGGIRGMNGGINNSSNGGFQSSDWICECGCQNFAKRSECFKCNRSKTISCVSYIDINSHNSSNNVSIFINVNYMYR